MENLRSTNYAVRSTILKYSILILLLISFISAKSQNSSTTDSIETINRIAFQDSIFKGLIKPKPYKSSQQEKAKSFVISDSTNIVLDTQKITQDFSIKNKDSISINAASQNLEVIKKKKQKKVDTTHYSPKKAAIWGASFPGLGQIYMKKYWKLPIVYGVIGAALYFVVSNGQNLKKYNGYIRNVYDSIPNPAPLDQLDLGNLETRRNSYRKNLQIASFGTVFAWGLSIVDAVVDAHLHSFDISDKLAIKVKPQINYSNFTYYTGIGLNLKFK